MDPSERSHQEQVARDVASEWHLVLEPPFQQSNYSYVAPAGPGAVLKVGWPYDEESLHEPDALALWAGDGAVRVLRVDRPRRAMLLERASPGQDLAALADAAATAIAIDVAGRLWRPAGPPFRSIRDYVPIWIAQATPESSAGQRLLEHARVLLDRSDVRDDTLLHGDFHHHNILDAGTRYLAIDPKPIVGEPEFDVPPFLWNPIGSQMTQAGTERRLALFAQAGLDESRMRTWALIRGAYLQVGDWIGEHAVEVLEAIQPR